jgi:2-polyprenyl-3-methyl-5-hydroxy-6-metoxy-1,4-benzoquinol methylase|uniref:Methyltransferase domain-containing protein n=1 Tax=viral metagenome TaxID=1070528 RepID=A0A6C0JNW5_9ZZZZ|tara:strand:- start:125 stop:784 length:660 start_codon:yes stop_codon:yes gene_type:complete
MNKHNLIVANQYDIISNTFDNSRVRIWNSVTNFLTNNCENKTLLESGCGNGKNMIFANSLGYKTKGFDISNKLLDICKEKDLDVYYSDVLDMDKTLKYDKILSIAVLHHLENEEMQKQAINNLLECLNQNGELLVSFWSKEKTFNTTTLKKTEKDYRNFNIGPNLVDWKLKDNTIKRFYYIHDYDSILALANNINSKNSNINFSLYWELQNWFIHFKVN